MLSCTTTTRPTAIWRREMFITDPILVHQVDRPGAVALPATLNQAAALAVRMAPDAVAISMYVPAGATEPVRVWLRTP